MERENFILAKDLFGCNVLIRPITILYIKEHQVVEGVLEVECRDGKHYLLEHTIEEFMDACDDSIEVSELEYSGELIKKSEDK
tara:strand:- start:217 stop:465 length:249 start_codon:yes stop_codon:yes gene_type:complete